MFSIAMLTLSAVQISPVAVIAYKVYDKFLEIWLLKQSKKIDMSVHLQWFVLPSLYNKNQISLY